MIRNPLLINKIIIDFIFLFYLCAWISSKIILFSVKKVVTLYTPVWKAEKREISLYEHSEGKQVWTEPSYCLALLGTSTPYIHMHGLIFFTFFFNTQSSVGKKDTPFYCNALNTFPQGPVAPSLSVFYSWVTLYYCSHVRKAPERPCNKSYWCNYESALHCFYYNWHSNILW